MRKIILLTLVALLTVISLVGSFQQNTQAQIGGAGNFDIASQVVRMAGDLFVGTDGTGSLTVDDNVTVGGTLTTDDLTVSDNFAVQGQLQPNVTGPTAVVDDGTIDCSDGGLFVMTAAGNIGTATVTTTTVEGVECTILLESNVTATLTDTGVLVLAGNAALTQNDTLCLTSANSVWYQTCKNAN